jgi:pimeloyl-ACP methyl ester carboxylesterase
MKDEGNTASIMEPPYTVSAVTSNDGTKIGYRQYGHGPGVIRVMGAMGTAHNYDKLARALASDFTVYVPDRRGRGMSPREYSPDHSIQKELEDLGSLLAQTGAHFVFGLSSGAVIAIEASRVLSSIHKAALYEPPFYLEGMSHDLVARFNREVGQGKLAAALVTASKIVRLGPALLKLIPRPLLELATTRVLRSEEKKGTGKYAPMRELLPAMRYDFKVVSEMDGKAESFKTVKAEILLLGGTKSPTYLKNALAALEIILPNVRREELKGLDHSGSWNSDQGGNPELVAQSLCRVFGE